MKNLQKSSSHNSARWLESQVVWRSIFIGSRKAPIDDKAKACETALYLRLAEQAPATRTRDSWRALGNAKAKKVVE